MVRRRRLGCPSADRFSAARNGTMRPGEGLLCEGRGEASFPWLGFIPGVVARDASRAGFPKAAAGLPHSKSVRVPQGFLRARACSRFAAEGSLLPGVGCSAWIAGAGAFGGWAHMLGWWCATPAELALPKRKQSFAHSKSVRVPQRFSSARACSRFVVEGNLLPGVGGSAWIPGVGVSRGWA